MPLRLIDIDQRLSDIELVLYSRAYPWARIGVWPPVFALSVAAASVSFLSRMGVF